MSRSIILLLYLVISILFSCSEAKTSVTTIHGEITECNECNVGYTNPVNGVLYFGFSENFKTDSTGHFQIDLKIDHPVFINIYSDGIGGMLLVEPELSYSVKLDMTKNPKSFTVSGANEAGQNLYNEMNKRFFIQRTAKEFMGNTIANVIVENIASQEEDEILKYGDLLNDGEISESYFILIKNDIECYYSALTATIPLLEFYITIDDPEKKLSLDLKQMWEDVLKKNPPTSEDNYISIWNYEYLNNYVKSKQFLDEHFNNTERKEINENGLWHTHNINEAKKHLSGDNLEYYISRYIHFYCYQKKYEKEFIELFAQFREEYPKSKFTKYIEPLINDIIEYYKIKTQDFSQNIKFIEEYENINSLRQVVSSLIGKMIYVDVWATWCAPCIIEFKHKDELKKLLKSKGIATLYISIDDENRDERWKGMIKHYDLEGYHIRANKKLKEDLENIYGQNLSIPWYIIIDENGSIIKKYAERPSKLKSLENELNGS